MSPDKTISMYLVMMEAIRKSCLTVGEFGQQMSTIFPLLESARVFSIPSETYLEATKVRSPMPSDLPFMEMLLLYPDGIPLTVEQMNQMGMGGDDDIAKFGMLSCIGHLVCQDHKIWSIFQSAVDLNGSTGIALDVSMVWGSSWTEVAQCRFEDLAVPTMLQTINSYQTVINQISRSQAKKTARRLTRHNPKHLPPALYTLELKHKVISEPQHTGFHCASSQTHRSDVRGHYRLRVVRGEGRPEEKKKVELKSKGYKFIDLPLVGEDAALILNRRVRPPHPGEWMAVKKSWVNSYIKGPADGPYIPSIRNVPLKGNG